MPTPSPDELPLETADSLAHVHPSESNPHPLVPLPSAEGDLPFPLDQTFIHRGWLPVRRRVFHALDAVLGDCARTRRFAACGAGAWVWRSAAEPGVVTVHSDWCRDRWCQVCARHRASRLSWNLADYCEGRTIRFVTLTQCHKFEDAKSSVNRLLAAFGRLRRSRAWRSHVVGGCACLELKLSKSARLWHTHLHVIVEGNFFPHAELKLAWSVASPGSCVVDVRAVSGTTEVARYVTKYVTKAVDGSVTADPQLLEDAIRGLHGRRLIITFGSWRGLDLDAPGEEGDWVPWCPLTRLIRAADQGDVEALAALQYLKQRGEIQCPIQPTVSNPLPP